MTGVKWEKTRTPGVYRRDGTRGRHYRHVYRDQTGRQIACSTCRTLDAAEKHQARMRTDRPEDVAAGRITLRAVYDEMVASHEADGEAYARASLDLYESCWKHLKGLADKDVGRIGTRAVSDALNAITAPVMREKTRKVLTTTFTYAIEKHYLAVSPVPIQRTRTTRTAKMRRRAEEGKRPRVLDDSELAALVAEMPERWQAMVKLMAHVGLRPGEAVALTVGKLDPLGRKLTVDTSLTGFTKTGQSRVIDLPSSVVEMLTEHLAKFSDPSDPEAPMFPKQDGKAITSKPSYDAWSRNHFRPAAERAGVNHGLSPNDCRHMAAARAIAVGANVYDVATMLGHSKPSITLDIYGYLWKGSLKAVADKLDERIRDEAAHPANPTVVVLHSR
jgi:integrase